MKLITSSLPYIHGVPHLGNIVGSIMPADIYARFCRLNGEKVLYICGSDSHGTMYEFTAREKGITPKELVYSNHEDVKKILESFEIIFDHYGITDSEATKEMTYHIFRQLDKNGFLEEKEVENAYCPNCKMFLADRWIEGKCPHCGGLGRGDQCDDCGSLLDPKDIIGAHCKKCMGPLEFKKTKHIYLQLPKFETWLKEWVEKSKGWSKIAKNETVGFLKTGLKERSISRDCSWGFPIPKKGYEDKVFYVWFDAPIGYISFTKEVCKDNAEFERWWKTAPDGKSDTELVQFMGKDNTIFHSVIFPSILYGCKENWKLVDRIITSGMLKTEGVKFSKSRGKGLTTPEALKMYPADYWRFALTAMYPESDDSIFSMEVFKEKINNEFADIIGNYVHRVISFCASNYGEIPRIDKPLEVGIIEEAQEVYCKITDSFSEGRFQEALKNIVHYAKISNAYFNNKEPWKLDGGEKVEVCFISGNLVRNLAIMLYPIVPAFSEEVFSFLNIDKTKVKWEDARKFDFSGKVNKSRPLVQKLDK